MRIFLLAVLFFSFCKKEEKFFEFKKPERSTGSPDYSLSLDQTGERLASVGYHEYIFIWDTKNKTLLKSLFDPSFGVKEADYKENMRFSDFFSKNKLLTTTLNPSLSYVKFFNNDKNIISSGTIELHGDYQQRRRFINIWDVETGKIVSSKSSNKGGYVSMNAKENIVEVVEDNIQFYKLKDFKNFCTITIEEGQWISKIDFPNHGNLFFFADNSKKEKSFINVYNIDSCKKIYMIEHSKAISAIGMHPSQKFLMVGSYTNLVQIYTIEPDGYVLSRQFEQFEYWLMYTISFSNNGEYFALGFSNGNVCIYDFESLEKLKCVYEFYPKDVLFNHNNTGIFIAGLPRLFYYDFTKEKFYKDRNTPPKPQKPPDPIIFVP